MSTKLGNLIAKATSDPDFRFGALSHYITPEFLKDIVWPQMKKSGAGGVDGVTIKTFKKDLDQRCHDIVRRLKENGYRPQPVRRIEIDKSPTEKRPLGIPTIEDRLLQKAVAIIMESIFEANFYDFSYGYRTGRSNHQAVEALRVQLEEGNTAYIVDADIKGFFNNIRHDLLLEMIQLRVTDPVIIQLIRRWLKMGAKMKGAGTPQGGNISPLLANIYLHHVLDEWFVQHIQAKYVGEVKLNRYVDDFLACFEFKDEADRFIGELMNRLEEFGLKLKKVDLISFGQIAPKMESVEAKQGFTFLGFEHSYQLGLTGMRLSRTPSQQTCSKFQIKTEKELKAGCRRRPVSLRKQRAHLNLRLKGFYNHFKLPECIPTLELIFNKTQQDWIEHLWAMGKDASEDLYELVPPPEAKPYKKRSSTANTNTNKV